MKTPPLTESFQHRPWISSKPPKKILVIRFHSFGDVVITLPYLQALKNALPDVELHLLTREECSNIPRHAAMFAKVHALDDKRNAKLLFAKVAALYPFLLRERYDSVIDLQRNSSSRMIRRALHPKSFCEYDRFSLHTAGERTKNTIDKLGFTQLPNELPKLVLRDNKIGLNKLFASHFNSAKKLFVLNPAGNFVTKNWPLEYYVQFARTWLETIDSKVQFAVIGVDAILSKAEFLKNRLGDNLISLVGSTTQAEAFNILQKADLVLTEDSGLMHMAWISQVPVIALFGSTKSVWSKPIGKFSVCLDSSDLDCGECAQPSCRFGDVHCLTRHTPDFVIKLAKELLQNKSYGE
jgi:ADP-heptose:LPS heptosyltransferase